MEINTMSQPLPGKRSCLLYQHVIQNFGIISLKIFKLPTKNTMPAIWVMNAKQSSLSFT